MRNSLLLFGVIIAVVIAGYVGASLARSLKEQAARLDPSTRYQLTLEMDGQYYISDHDLTYTDCMEKVHTVADWTAGHARYQCDVQPIPTK